MPPALCAVHYFDRPFDARSQLVALDRKEINKLEGGGTKAGRNYITGKGAVADALKPLGIELANAVSLCSAAGWLSLLNLKRTGPNLQVPQALLEFGWTANRQEL